MKNHIIFLDNDGVICLGDNMGSRFKKQKKAYRGKECPKTNEIDIHCRFDNFDNKAIKVLNRILDKTGAEIVVSSDWKNYATLDELGEYYNIQGINKKPIGVTGKFNDLFPSEWNVLRHRGDLEYERQAEIKHWLGEHPEVTHWVAVDDLNMSIEYFDGKAGLTNFVWTSNWYEGIKQTGIEGKILKYLL